MKLCLMWLKDPGARRGRANATLVSPFPHCHGATLHAARQLIFRYFAPTHQFTPFARRRSRSWKSSLRPLERPGHLYVASPGLLPLACGSGCAWFLIVVPSPFPPFSLTESHHSRGAVNGEGDPLYAPPDVPLCHQRKPGRQPPPAAASLFSFFSSFSVLPEALYPGTPGPMFLTPSSRLSPRPLPADDARRAGGDHCRAIVAGRVRPAQGQDPQHPPQRREVAVGGH